MAHTPVWKWVVGLVVLVLGAAVAIPVYRYADADDAPGGMVIAVLIFVGAAVLASLVVSQRGQVPEVTFSAPCARDTSPRGGS